jgi:hypothetical protein
MVTKFRELTTTDVPMLDKWIEADPVHRDTLPLSFWQSPGAFIISDTCGDVMLVRPHVPLDKDYEARLYVQFAPIEEVVPIRAAKAILKAFPIIEQAIKKSGMTEIVFDSSNESLIALMCTKFGFVHDIGRDYRKTI